MNRFNKIFNEKRKIFMPYFTLGDPNLDDNLNIIQSAVESGADALELGFPFSDPIADGPTHQKSMERSLQSGVDFKKCVNQIHKIREKYPDIPISLLLYYNILFRIGEESYRQLSDAKVDGIVCVDLPFEESHQHRKLMDKYKLGKVQLIGPNTSLERAKFLFNESNAYTYVISDYGTTGAKKSLSQFTLERISELKQVSDQPMIVGFGLSTPEQVAEVLSQGADGAIVGSYLTQKIEKYHDQPMKAQQEISSFIQDTKKLIN